MSEKEVADRAQAAAGEGSAGADRASAEDLTIFVDGIPYEWTEEKVTAFFEECGKIVQVKAPTWQDSGRLRGYAHVTFATTKGHKKALAKDGADCGKAGRYLKVQLAKGTVVQAPPSAAEVKGKRRLFVKNLPYDVMEAQVIALFKECGRITDVRIPTSFGRCKGFAYVEFEKSEGLQAAVSKQPAPAIGGRTLRLDVDVGSGPRAGFHYRPEAYDEKNTNDKGKGKGKKGASKGAGKGKLSLF